MMNNWFKKIFGIPDDTPRESYDETVERAKALLREHNEEDACRLLRHAEQENHAEGMYLLAWCYWNGAGVSEDAGRAIALWRKSASLGYAPATARNDELRRAKARMEAGDDSTDK